VTGGARSYDPGVVRVRLERVVLLAGMVLATVNIFTGGPLLGLWVGSRVVQDGQITMLAVLVIAVVMFAGCYLMTIVLAMLSNRHDRITGKTATVRRHTPWLRSMSGERPANMPGVRGELNALEYILVTAVVGVTILFELWFFLKAGSPFDQRSGRG
jgi:hypothetical protein